jgi:hypothetical protein
MMLVVGVVATMENESGCMVRLVWALARQRAMRRTSRRPWRSVPRRTRRIGPCRPGSESCDLGVAGIVVAAEEGQVGPAMGACTQIDVPPEDASRRSATRRARRVRRELYCDRIEALDGIVKNGDVEIHLDAPATDTARAMDDGVLVRFVPFEAVSVKVVAA